MPTVSLREQGVVKAVRERVADRNGPSTIDGFGKQELWRFWPLPPCGGGWVGGGGREPALLKLRLPQLQGKEVLSPGSPPHPAVWNCTCTPKPSAVCRAS
ncbi:hypothetical protein DAERI_130108 [Deinococcus aerius]|uniref:Uncharacterized protein n=1 Tax=Deinococcus aerius TaxID=200253 RepID=A0A2I9DLD6_9DEIO|nr:hypothetical protein DAERI_130108 [Deinococcus aerius]